MDNSEDVQITSHSCVYIALFLPQTKKETRHKKENNINTCVTEDLYSTVLHTTQLDAMLKDTLTPYRMIFCISEKKNILSVK